MNFTLIFFKVTLPPNTSELKFKPEFRWSGCTWPHSIGIIIQVLHAIKNTHHKVLNWFSAFYYSVEFENVSQYL